MNDSKSKNLHKASLENEGKTLLLVRHAKSDWNDASLADFDRPLNERGKREAPTMAKRLNDKKIKIDALVTSPARRARQTCKHFAKEFGFKKKDIVKDEKLYEASEEDFYEVVEHLKNKWDSVAIFSHNPGITSFANSLTDSHVDDMTTSSIFAIKIDTDNWASFKKAKKEFWFFEYPKSVE